MKYISKYYLIAAVFAAAGVMGFLLLGIPVDAFTLLLSKLGFDTNYALMLNQVLFIFFLCGGGYLITEDYLKKNPVV